MFIVLAVLLVALVVAAAFGVLADTRDTEFDLGRVLRTPDAPNR